MNAIPVTISKIRPNILDAERLQNASCAVGDWRWPPMLIHIHMNECALGTQFAAGTTHLHPTNAHGSRVTKNPNGVRCRGSAKLCDPQSDFNGLRILQTSYVVARR